MIQQGINTSWDCDNIRLVPSGDITAYRKRMCQGSRENDTTDEVLHDMICWGTVEPRYNEPLYNNVITNDILRPKVVQYMENNLDIMKPRYSEHILAVPWPFVKSRSHSTIFIFNNERLSSD